MSGVTQRFNGEVSASAAMDNAVAYAFREGRNVQRHRITGFIATYSAAVTGVKTVILKRGAFTVSDAATGPLTTCTLSRGSTDTKIQTSIVQYFIKGLNYQKAAVAAGTTLAAGTIPIDKWGLYLVSVNAAGTITTTPAAANFTTGYATEAAAIAALPTTPSNDASLGYFTVQTKTGTTFVGGTDALNGGASGNVANATNYYSTAVLIPTTTILTIPILFTGNNAVVELPGVISTGPGECVSAELEASGTGGTTGRVNLFTFGE